MDVRHRWHQADAMSADIVKALRTKCNNLEDELDAEEEARDTALAYNRELEEGLAALRAELEAEREAARSLAEPGAEAGGEDGGSGAEKEAALRSEVEALQETLADARDEGKKLEDRLHEITASAEVLQGELSKVEEDLDDEAKHLEMIQGKLAAQREALASREREAVKSKADSEAALAEAREKLRSVEEELAKAEQEHTELSTSWTTAQQQAEEAALARDTLKADVTTMDRDHKAREAALECGRNDHIDNLQKALSEEEARLTELQQNGQQFEAMRQRLEKLLAEAAASQDVLLEKLSKVRGELYTASEAVHEASKAASQADRALAEEMKLEVQRREALVKVSAERDAALDRLQEAELAKDSLESKVAAFAQGLKPSEAALAVEHDAHIAALQAKVLQERNLLTQLELTHNELKGTNSDIEERLRQSTALIESLQVEVSKAEDAHTAAKTAGGDKREQAGRMRLELADASKHRQQACKEHGELASDHEDALRRMQEAERSKAREGEQNITLTEQLEAERRMRAAEAESYSGLQRQHDGHVTARDEHQQRADALCDQLEAERRSRMSAADRRHALQRRHDELSREWGRQQRRVADLSEEVQAERNRRAENAASHSECKGLHDQISDEHLTVENLAASLVEELESEKQFSASEAEHLEELQAECERLFTEEKACAEMHARTKAEIERIAEAHVQERQFASELHMRLEAIQPIHENLCTRYSAAVEQIENLRGERDRVTLEKESLCTSLEEEVAEAERLRRAREEAEPPGPTQLSVSDVLISVAFEGVKAPLELKPWDTNLEDVVTEWISAVQIKPHLKESILRYLKHLEESTCAFPVHAYAKLLEVHEQFAL